MKVEMSPDGNFCFFGGEGLNVLELTDGVYTMARKDKEKSKFHFWMFSNFFRD